MKRTLSTIHKKLLARFGPQHWWPAETPFEMAVGAILTQNTSWANVEKAIANLKKDGRLSARKIHRMPTAGLAGLIRPAGYFNVKAERLKHFIVFLMNDYRGSMSEMKKEPLPVIREKLLSVNGIGPETADSIILYGLEKPVFVIDAYTKRMLSRHTIMHLDASYEEFQAIFHAHLKEDVRLFNEYHALIVRLAKDYCRAKPVCSGCPLEGM